VVEGRGEAIVPGRAFVSSQRVEMRREVVRRLRVKNKEGDAK